METANIKTTEINNQEVQGVNIFDIAAKPEDFPVELQFAAFEVLIKNMIPKLKEAKARLEHNLKRDMELDNASKFPFIGVDNVEKIATLKNGSFKADKSIKDPDIVFQKQGFDPNEIGEYVFVLKWVLAKEARKMGGDKQIAIDNFFKRSAPTIEIKDVK